MPSGAEDFTSKLPHRLGARHPDLHPRLFWDYVSLHEECSAGIDTHHQAWQGAEQSQTPSLAWVPPCNTLQSWSTPTTLRIADKGGVKASPEIKPSCAGIRLAGCLPPAACTRHGQEMGNVVGWAAEAHGC